MDLNNIEYKRTFNKREIPVTYLNNVDEFNSVIDQFNELGYKYGIKFTKNYNICSRGHVPYSYEVIEYKGSMAGWQIWAVTDKGSCILQFNPTMDENGDVVGKNIKKGGTYALNRFTAELKKQCNIDLVSYALSGEDAVAEKSKIPKALIGPTQDYYVARTLEHCYHLDINSAYPAGLKESFPEFGPVIDWLYEKKKNSITKEEKSESKLILNSLIGKMQSDTIHYMYAHMSRAAIEYCRNKLIKMRDYLRKQGCSVVMFNTDGLWFIPPMNKLPHIPDLGEGLGQWKLDHMDCTLCMKNANYEFIENGVYTPVVRGKTKLDKIKPRSQWQWGDIFKREAEQPLQIIQDLTTHKLIWIESEGDYVKETIQ